MRRDLSRGCAVCRLRFSSQLALCPVCRGAPLAVDEAIRQVQPTSRAAWFAKWVIVLSCFPAIGLVIFAGLELLRQGWPPQRALDIVMYVLGGMGTALGASIAVAIPLALWIGIITAIRFILTFIVDRPGRTLRVSIETKERPRDLARPHLMHRLWRKIELFANNLEDHQEKTIGAVMLVLLGLQLLAEIFGNERIINFRSWSDFGSSLLVLGVVNVLGVVVLGIFVGAFGWFFGKAKEFLDKPPNLFGYDPRPPDLKNEECLREISDKRTEFIGTISRLSSAEKEALGHEVKDELVAPLSGQTCLAFRLTGDADGQPVDDADATHFALITNDQNRCVVQVHDVIVDVPAKMKMRADSARGFLQERGLQEDDLSLKEGVLREGDPVRVWGRTVDLRVGAAGYRGDERRLLIDAGDGLPVLIQAVEEAPI